MKVRRVQCSDGQMSFELLDDVGQPMSEVSGFMRFLNARSCSPNTLAAYIHDLLHFTRFLSQHRLDFDDFSPAQSLLFLEYLRSAPNGRATHRYSLVLCSDATTQTSGISRTVGAAGTAGKEGPGTRLVPTTINRALAAVSSFYEYLIVSAQLSTRQNPIGKQYDPAFARVVDDMSGPSLHYGNWPSAGGSLQASYHTWGWRKPIRRTLMVKTAQFLPRPMSDEQVEQLLHSFSKWRDKAMLLLMLQGGLRPGEVLSLHLEDMQYGHRRVIVRYRTDHPKRVRTKSRRERVVDLHEPEALHAVATYIMQERPVDVGSPYLFLVGGKGKRRGEPLGYHALVKMFQRHCERLNIREYWMTPHALRHTHATRMWEQGMRELTLQKRLGHASLDSTRRYTRVSEQTVVAEYRHALGLGKVSSQDSTQVRGERAEFVRDMNKKGGMDGEITERTKLVEAENAEQDGGEERGEREERRNKQ
jgi:site-specific recombinase XerD